MQADKRQQIESEDYKLVAIMNGIFWACIFGFYALRFDGDPEVCLASDDQDLRVDKPVADGEYEDVGYRFRLVFSVSFYAALL